MIIFYSGVTGRLKQVSSNVAGTTPVMLSYYNSRKKPERTFRKLRKANKRKDKNEKQNL